MDIGEKIKKIRELRNYTQEYMAEKLSMTQTGYGKIERNESEISFQKLTRIAGLLKVEIGDIINFDQQWIFNAMHRTGDRSHLTDGGVSDHERKLYDQIILQQKEEINFLKRIIEQGPRM